MDLPQIPPQRAVASLQGRRRAASMRSRAVWGGLASAAIAAMPCWGEERHSLAAGGGVVDPRPGVGSFNREELLKPHVAKFQRPTLIGGGPRQGQERTIAP